MADFDARRCEQCGEIHDDDHEDSLNEGEHLGKVAEEAFFDLVRERVRERLRISNGAEIERAAEIALEAMKLLWREDMRGSRDDSAWETLHLKALAIWKHPGSKT